MVDDFGGRMVPVRLALSYSNGITVSHNGRAVCREEDELLVVVPQRFEAGTQLSLWAPLFKGRLICRVRCAAPSTRWMGAFETTLRLGDNAGSQARAGAAAEAARPAAASAEAAFPAGLTEAFSEEKLATSAHQLAGALENLPESRFGQAFNAVPVSSRRPALLVVTAALLHLLQQKGMVQVRSLFLHVKEAAKTP